MVTENKDLRDFIEKQFDGIGLDDETKEVFADTLHAYETHQAKAIKYALESWPRRDDLPTGDPIGDIDDSSHIGYDKSKGSDESYYTVIRQAGAHIDHKDCVQPFNRTNCCSNPQNHKKVPVFTSVITVCSVCNEKVV